MPTTTIHGVELSYDQLGPTDGQPIVFIHGLSSSRGDWEQNVTAFDDRYRVIALDLRGHGQSHRAEPYTIQQYAADVAALIEQLGSPAHVVGTSMGGMIVLQLALDRPELVRSMTVVNSVPTLVPRHVGEWAVLRGQVLALQVLPMGLVCRFMARGMYPKGPPKLRDAFYDQCVLVDRRHLVKLMMSMKGWTVIDRLHEIGCPTLVIAAEKDIFPTKAARAMVERMPNAQLAVEPGVGHCFNIEQPDRFNALLDGFLGSLDETARD